MVKENKKRRKGLIDRIKETAKSEKIESKEEVEEYISIKAPPSPINNFVKDLKILKAYKYAEVHRIRERLVNIFSKEKVKSCVVTSPEDGVGNTFFTCIVALNLSFFSSMNVLIVDANLRKPSLHNIFTVQDEKGIADVILRIATPEDVIQRMPYENFSVITAGKTREDMSKYINRSILQQFLIETSKEFDIIFFDTSPVLVNNRNNIDPSVLSNICDITFLTVLNFKTTKSQLKEMVEILKNAGAKIGGVFYNNYLFPSKFSLPYLFKLLGFKRQKDLKFVETLIP